MPELDTGNNAWILISAALVLLMTPGLALFYGGLSRASSVINMHDARCAIRRAAGPPRRPMRRGTAPPPSAGKRGS